MDNNTIKLSLNEKIALISGKNDWETKDLPKLGVPSLLLCDGPHGLRKEIIEENTLGLRKSIDAVCFPPAVTLASSWDPLLAYEVAQSIAEHCIKENVSIILGPGVNIKRSPLCGRNFEYFSEDPYLTGQMGSLWVKGAQSKGIGTSLKHFALNNQESFRMVNNSIVDHRAMREIYLSAFETIIKEAKPSTIMCSYNLVNGVYASENKQLLTDILRNEWGFEGVVISDWGATNNRVLGLKNGLDLEMPSSMGQNNQSVLDAIHHNTLSIEVVDQSVKRMLDLVSSIKPPQESMNIDFEKQHLLAKKVATESMVLLRNEGVLPLKSTSKITLIGSLAKSPKIQGVGSSKVHPIKLPSMIDIFTLNQVSFEYLDDEYFKDEITGKSLNIDNYSDYTIVFVGLDESSESEGLDRKNLDLPQSQNTLINHLSAQERKIIVIVMAGGPVLMPWLNQVDAVIHAHLGGQAVSEALYDIIFGIANPSGKLAETHPLCIQDTPAYQTFAKDWQVTPYLESIFVGYRYYETANKDVLFPFGFGLSYTSFEYQKLTLDQNVINEDEFVTINITIKNTGNCIGKEIIQVYMHKQNTQIIREKIRLINFEKVSLEPLETKTIALTLKPRNFAIYNTETSSFEVEDGRYDILVGSSSRNIYLNETLKIVSTKTQSTNITLIIDAYMNLSHPGHNFNLEGFKMLYNSDFPVITSKKTTLNSPLSEVKKTFFGGILYRGMTKQIKKVSNQGEALIDTLAVIEQMPLRGLALLSHGKFTLKQAKIWVSLINWRLIGACKQFFQK